MSADRGKPEGSTQRDMINTSMVESSRLVPRPTPFFVLRFALTIVNVNRKKQGRPGSEAKNLACLSLSRAPYLCLAPITFVLND